MSLAPADTAPRKNPPRARVARLLFFNLSLFAPPLSQGCKYVVERRDAVSIGLPPLAGPLRNIANDLKTLQGEFRELRDSYVKVRRKSKERSLPPPLDTPVFWGWGERRLKGA